MQLAYGAAMGTAGPLWAALQARRAARPWSAFRERMAWTRPEVAPAPLWLHAASLGEVGVAATLLRAVRARHPRLPLLLTAFTETGWERARAVPGVTAARLPLDLPRPMGRFLDAVGPRALWVVETELWPNLLRQAHRRGVPVALVNARLSAAAAARYARLQGWLRPLLAALAAVAARSEADAERWMALGVPPSAVRVCGNLKFDQWTEAPAPWHQPGLVPGQRFVWVAGSVRPHEEAAVLAAHRRLRAQVAGALLIWAPRHPERFEPVVRMLREAGMPLVRRSTGAPVTAETAVLVLDTLGELAQAYGVAEAAFVGGTLHPEYGGHSPVEPAALGRPVLLGPHRAHFEEEAAALEAVGGACTVADAEALAAALIRWAEAPEARRQAGARAQAVVAANRGATRRSLAWLAQRMPPAVGLSGATD